MPVIAMLNQKGGVGKTSTCYHLAGALAQMGRRVLLVDNDPQASLTQGFLGSDGMVSLSAAETIHAVYSREAFPDQVIRGVLADVVPGIDLLPATDLDQGYNQHYPERLPDADQFCIRDFLDEAAARSRYDFTLIDCPPNLYLCSWAALAAADSLVVPVNPEDFGAQGLAKVLDSIDLVRERVNPGLAVAGYLVSRFGARKTLHQKYLGKLRSNFGDDVFAAVIPDSIDYPEAVTVGKPVTLYKPKSGAAKAIRAVAEELEARAAVRRAA
jgi:chromosome partitioning protein